MLLIYIIKLYMDIRLNNEPESQELILSTCAASLHQLITLLSCTAIFILTMNLSLQNTNY